MFLDFFSVNDHHIVSSAPLVPDNDPSLLFTNAGMVQFKDMFLGKSPAKYSAAVTCQKCVRAGGKHNDLENVGYTGRHHTFFEMLGNFSFGGYFKEQAIAMAWHFLTEKLGLPTDKLYITVSDRDPDAFDIWQKLTGFGVERIISVAGSDNFWSMGDTGPCGPCTEIFYDYGPSYAGSLTADNYDPDERYIEIWNLVFMQYNMHADGQLTELPLKCIDTGMGLERVAAVCQGVHDNYENDLFKDIMAHVRRQTGDDAHDDSSPAMRVVADHARAAAFLIADGVLPSNVGRGYALRKIIRRAIRYSHKIQNSGFLLGKTVPYIAQIMGDIYPELREQQELIISALDAEEVQFSEAISRGVQFLGKQIETGCVADDLTFRLYDTYGFPFDMSQEILKEHGINAKEEDFDRYMAVQQERGRDSWKTGVDLSTLAGMLPTQATEFVGYGNYEQDATVIGIVCLGQSAESLMLGQEGLVVLDTTSFYGTSGGQNGDSGWLKSGGSIVAEVQDCDKVGQTYIHKCIAKAIINVGDKITTAIDKNKRRDTARNHSATHLLHFALRKVLGKHVTQKGSLVSSDRLRFDFSHNSQLSEAELEKIEDCVNHFIDAGLVTETEVLPIAEAKAKGAIALFGEKYDDMVRVVTMGVGDDCSLELCGGTHVKNTADIRLFKITSVSAIGSGMRRLEAVTGRQAIAMMIKRDRTLRSIELSLKDSTDAALAVKKLQDSHQDLVKKLDKARGYMQMSNVFSDYVCHSPSYADSACAIAQKALDALTAGEIMLLRDKIIGVSDGPVALCLVRMTSPRMSADYMGQLAALGGPKIVVGIEMLSQQFGKIRILVPDAIGIAPDQLVKVAVAPKGKITRSGQVHEAGFAVQDTDVERIIFEKLRDYLASL